MGDSRRSDLVFFRQHGGRLRAANSSCRQIPWNNHAGGQTRPESPYQLSDNTQRYCHLRHGCFWPLSMLTWNQLGKGGHSTATGWPLRGCLTAVLGNSIMGFWLTPKMTNSPACSKWSKASATLQVPWGHLVGEDFQPSARLGMFKDTVDRAQNIVLRKVK